MPNDSGVFGRIFVFVQKFFGTRKGHLVDVFLHFVGGHSQSLVNDVQFFAVFVNFDFYLRLAIFYVGFANTAKVFQFKGSVCSVGNQFPQENFVVAI